MKRNKNSEERWMMRKPEEEQEKMKRKLNSDAKKIQKRRKKENRNMNRKCKLDNWYSWSGKKKGESRDNKRF